MLLLCMKYIKITYAELSKNFTMATDKMIPVFKTVLLFYPKASPLQTKAYCNEPLVHIEAD